MSHMTDALYLTPLRSLSENLSTFQNSQFFNILGYDSSPPMTALNSDLRYNLQNNNMANSKFDMYSAINRQQLKTVRIPSGVIKVCDMRVESDMK